MRKGQLVQPLDVLGAGNKTQQNKKTHERNRRKKKNKSKPDFFRAYGVRAGPRNARRRQSIRIKYFSRALPMRDTLTP